MEINDTKTLFHYTLCEIYKTETIISQTVPMMIDITKNDGIKRLLQEHLEETNKQVTRVKKVMDKFGFEQKDLESPVENLISKAKEMMPMIKDEASMDFALLGAAEKLANLQISMYSAAITLSLLMNDSYCTSLLKQSLFEEKATLETIGSESMEEVQKVLNNKIS